MQCIVGLGVLSKSHDNVNDNVVTMTTTRKQIVKELLFQEYIMLPQKSTMLASEKKLADLMFE